MKNENETVVLEQSHKPRKAKSREVSSRFLSPGSTSSIEKEIPALNQATSPTRRKFRTNSIDNRKIRSQEGSGFIQGLWPSSTSTSSSSNKKLDTLADHLGNDRLKDLHRKPVNSNEFMVDKLRSSIECGRIEFERENAKENHRPTIGGSMRYLGKFQFPGKNHVSSSSSNVHSQNLESEKFSVDENVLYGKASRRKSDASKDNIDMEPHSSYICSKGDQNSPVSGKNSTVVSQKSGTIVCSKYVNDKPRRPQRASSDPNVPHPVSLDSSSPTAKKFTIKNAIKRANSITGYGSTMTQWALSPGRSDLPPMTVENKEKPMSFSSLKPSSSAKGVEKLLNLGFDLFKSKKASVSITSPVGLGNSDGVHQLKLLHNRMMQWRYVNARAAAVNNSISNTAKTNLMYSWHSITKLQHSVQKKKVQLERETLEMKLNFILLSQLKPLEAWGDLERQHLTALSKTKECLHSVVCKVPLIEGAKGETQNIYAAFRHASDLTTAISSIVTILSPSAMETASLLFDLAKVATQEKLLLEEFLELYNSISTLEVKEMSLKSAIIQLKH